MANYYRSDPPLNCFPSLHAENSTITAYYLSREFPKYKLVFWGIAFLVILSTLFVRQHVIADEIGGFLVAYFAGWVSEKYVKEENIEDKYKLFRLAFMLVLATLVTVFTIASYLP